MLRLLFRRQLLGRARWVAAAATLALTATVGLTIASPAHAEALPIADSFENGQWTTEGVPGMTDAVVGSFLGPHSGTELAYLDAYPNAPAEARVFRTITLNNGVPLPGTCQASVYLHAIAISGQVNVQVWLKVHSGGRTGQIISVWGYNVIGTGWDATPNKFRAFRWPGDSRTVTVEIAAYRGVGAADDFTLSC